MSLAVELSPGALKKMRNLSTIRMAIHNFEIYIHLISPGGFIYDLSLEFVELNYYYHPMKS